jgi:regulator of sigma E protease
MTSLWSFLLAIAILVGVHEYGHYKTAVALGVKVLRFSLGFGPVIFRSSMGRQVLSDDGAQKGETEFVISLIPLGGYVTFLDENSDPELHEDWSRAFHRQSLLSRSLIVAAGPLANFLLAVVMLVLMNLYGFESVAPILSTPAIESVAQKASIESGMRVLKMAPKGEELKEIASYAQFEKAVLQGLSSHQSLDLVMANPLGHSKALTPIELDLSSVHLPLNGADHEAHALELEDQERVLQATIRENPRAVMTLLGFLGPYSQAVLGRVSPGGAADQAGLIEGDKVLSINERPIADAYALRTHIAKSGQFEPIEAQTWRIERKGVPEPVLLSLTPQRRMQGKEGVGRIEAYVGSPAERVWVQEGPLGAFQVACSTAYEWTYQTVVSIYQLVAGNTQLSQLGGPISLAKYAGESVHLGFAAFLSYLALVSINLAVFNLLPIPALDGGHLLCYCWEGLSGRALSERFIQGFQKIGLFFILALSVYAIRNDLMRAWGLSP